MCDTALAQHLTTVNIEPVDGSTVDRNDLGRDLPIVYIVLSATCPL